MKRNISVSRQRGNDNKNPVFVTLPFSTIASLLMDLWKNQVRLNEAEMLIHLAVEFDFLVRSRVSSNLQKCVYFENYSQEIKRTYKTS